MSSDTKERISVEENPSGIKGLLTLDEGVVATIARMAAKTIPGIYSVGKTPFIPIGSERTRGVNVEVGKKQAAFDLDVGRGRRVRPGHPADRQAASREDCEGSGPDGRTGSH